MLYLAMFEMKFSFLKKVIALSQSNTQRKFLFYLIMFIMTLSVSLLLGEIVARLFVTPNRLPAQLPLEQIDPYQANPYMVNRRPYIHFHNPNSQYIQARSYYQVKYEINTRAFRGAEIPPKVETGLKRLLIIGDSMVEGHGSELQDTFAYLLDVDLRPLGWEVVNVGVQGGSPIYYAANLDRYLALQPDAVLIVLFENDLYDDRLLERNFFNLPLLDDDTVLLGQSSWQHYLTYSYLYIVLHRAWEKWYTSPFEAIVTHNQQAHTSNAEQEQLNALSPWLVAPSLFNMQWTMSQAYLDYMVAILHQQSIQIMITDLCFGTLAPGVDKAYREHAQNLDNHVKQWTIAQHLPFLSLLPTIEKVFSEQEVADIMIVDDGHPTATGHLLIKETLQPWLRKQLKK